MDNVINFLKKKKDEVVKNVMDDKGLFQRGQFTPIRAIPGVNQANKAIGDFAVNTTKDLTYNTRQTAKPIFDYLDPRGYQAERNSISQGGNLGQQKMIGAAKAMPMTAVNAFALSKVRPAMTLTSGLLGGGINKLSGGSFQEGWQKGVRSAPTIAGITAASRPIIGQLGNTLANSRVAKPIVSRFGAEAVNRVGQGLANIPEGMAINRGMGIKSYTPVDAALDFGLGTLGADRVGGNVKVKGSVRKTIDQETLNEVDGLRDYFNQAIKGKIQLDPRTTLDVDRIAGQWLPKSDIDAVLKKSEGKRNVVYYRNLLDKVANKVGDYNSRYEGFQMGIMSKDQAKAKLPKIMYESTAERIQKSPGFQQRGEEILSKARQEIGPKQDVKGTIKQKFNELYTDWVNRFHPVESLTSQVEKATKSEIRPEFNPKYTIKRLLGAGGTAELRHKQQLQPIINQLGTDVDMKDFDVYMKAKRDIELGGRGIKGSDPKLAEERIQALGQKYDIKQLDRVAEQLYSYQRQGLRKLQEAGFLSDQAVQNIQSMNQKYVPFQRIQDELDNYLGVPSAKLQQSTTPVQKIKGSDKAIESPLESVIANTYKIEAAVAKNNVAKSIVNLSNIDPKFQNLFTKTSKSGADTIAVWENGKKQFYSAPDEIVKVVKGLNEENMGTLVNILSIPSRFFRQQTTGRNPAFFIPNAVRDQFDAAINAKYGYIPFFDYMQGLGHLWKYKYGGGDQLVEQWYKSGGSIFFESMGGRKEIRKQIEDATADKKLTQKAIDALVNGIGVVGEFSEQPTRLGVFKRALQKTGNTDIAGYESREATLDFARMGAKMKAANSLIPFLNVGVQGFDKMIRVAKDNPGKITMAMTGYALFPQTLTTLYNIMTNPEGYAQIPDFEKQDNFIILDGGKDREGNPTYIKIPKGHTQALLTQPMENLLAYMYGNNPQSFTQMALSMLTSALPVIGEGDNLGDIAVSTGGSNIPQFAKPAVEVAMNKDTFRNKPIVDPYTAQLPPAAQFYQNTPEQYKELGRKLNLSPEKLQYLSEGYGGGLTKEFQNLQSTGQDIAAGNPLDPNKIPLVRRFRGSYSGFDTDRPQNEEPVDVPKSIQDRQAKLDLKNSDKKSLRVGNTIYVKKTDKNGKVSISKKEVGPTATEQAKNTQQGFLDNIFKPAKKFEPQANIKEDAKGYIEANEISTEVPSDPLKKAVYQRKSLTAAKKVFNDENIDDTLKNEVLQQMGYNVDDIRYDIAANLPTVDEKALYMSERMQGMTEERIKQFLEDSRTKSLSGDFLATKGVLEKLVEAGIIDESTKSYLLSFEKEIDSKTRKYTKKAKKGSIKLGTTPKYSSPKISIKTSPISVNIPQQAVKIARISGGNQQKSINLKSGRNVINTGRLRVRA